MIEKFLKAIFIVLGILIFVNLLFLDFTWVKNRGGKDVVEQKISPVPTTVTPTPIITPSVQDDSCPSACQQLIADEAAKVSSKSKEVVKETTVVKEAASSKVLYLSLGGSSTTNSTSWVDISGSDFYFDLANYSGVKGVRWEVSLRSFLAYNPVYARLYDVTNKRAVDFSELSTLKDTSEFLRSSDLVIWRGNNLYRIQARSESGNIAFLDSPRLKIILE